MDEEDNNPTQNPETEDEATTEDEVNLRALNNSVAPASPRDPPVQYVQQTLGAVGAWCRDNPWTTVGIAVFGYLVFSRK